MLVSIHLVTATKSFMPVVLNAKPELRLLEASNNKKGDLFTRLKADLFYALGYKDLRFDVQKPGREIDIVGTHRTENRRVVAECKAHQAKMGGSEVNKFRGAAACERDEHEAIPMAAYFVSLGGFTETVIEQEKQVKPSNRLILLDSEKIISELINARILIDQTAAAEKAGRCAQNLGLTDATLDGAVLLGHKIGYLWAIFYAQGKQRNHFALIHADGTPLSKAVAKKLRPPTKAVTVNYINILTWHRQSPNQISWH